MKVVIQIVVLLFAFAITSCQGDTSSDEVNKNNDTTTVDQDPVKDDQSYDTTWANLNITSATAYMFYPRPTTSGLIYDIEKNQLSSDTLSDFVKPITGENFKILYHHLIKQKNKFQPPNDCYMPHHGIVFKNAEDSVVAHITISFYCRRSRSFPAKADGFHLNYSFLKIFFTENLNIPVYYSIDEINNLYDSIHSPK